MPLQSTPLPRSFATTVHKNRSANGRIIFPVSSFSPVSETFHRFRIFFSPKTGWVAGWLIALLRLSVAPRFFAEWQNTDAPFFAYASWSEHPTAGCEPATRFVFKGHCSRHYLPRVGCFMVRGSFEIEGRMSVGKMSRCRFRKTTTVLLRQVFFLEIQIT